MKFEFEQTFYTNFRIVSHGYFQTVKKNQALFFLKP